MTTKIQPLNDDTGPLSPEETAFEGATDRLVCGDPACETHTSATAFSTFIVRLEVDAAGNVISDVDDIETRYFDCSYCGSEATTEVA